MKLRLRKTAIVYISLLFGGIVYAIICSWLGFGIPCVFREVTGLQCPGCGISRMCIALLKLDLRGAFAANPVALVLLPFLGAILADITVRYVKTGSKETKGWSTILGCVILVVLILFGIIRNLV